MDTLESEKENNCAETPKYPDSVVKLSEFIKDVENEISKDIVQSKDEEETESDTTIRKESSKSSTDSSTSTLSTCSSVTCGHHSCGSLFAKCAEHGRWPLLQTFSNKNSPLFQQTFSNRHNPKRTHSTDEISLKPKNNQYFQQLQYHKNFSISTPSKTILRSSEDNLHGILSRKDKRKSKNKVKFVCGVPEPADAKTEYDEGKPNQQVSVRRHNSVSDRKSTLDSKMINDFEKIFNKSSMDSKEDPRTRGFLSQNYGNSRKHIITGRGRSKSEDKTNLRRYMQEKNFEENRNIYRIAEGHAKYNWSDPRNSKKSENYQDAFPLKAKDLNLGNGKAISNDNFKVSDIYKVSYFFILFCNILK